MKKIYENVLTIVGGCVLIGGFLTACGEQNIAADKNEAVVQVSEYKQLKAFDNKFVIDTFKINEVDGDEVRGEIIKTTAPKQIQTGEGIYLLKSQKASYQSVVQSIHKGDIVEVTYLKKDYEQSIWDNILDVEVK
jgi:hypothetical protein